MQLLSKLATGPTAQLVRSKRRQCTGLSFTTTRSPNNAAQTGSVGSDTCSILAPEGAGRPNYKPSRLSPEPLSAPEQTTFPAPPAPGQPCRAIWPLYLQYVRRDHKESKQAGSSRQKSQPQVKGRARVLSFKARDQISQSRCCDCVKISSKSFYFIALCLLKILNHWQRIFLRRLFSSLKTCFHTCTADQMYMIQVSLEFH